MGTVTITGVAPDPEIYGVSLAAAVNHVKSRFGPTYKAWLAIAADPDQAQTLVSATDAMDRLGLIDPATGAAIGHATTIVDVQKACYELAVLIFDDPDVVAQVDASSNIKAVRAGGAGVDFFVPTSTSDGSAEQLPHVIQQLLGPYLGGANGGDTVLGGYGRSGSACLDDGGDLERNGPY